MAKIKYLPHAYYPYHITARCINKDWFRIPIDEVWGIMSNYLFFLKHGFGFEIINFVLMENHFHLIARTPEANLSQGMNYFMRETSRSIANVSGRINQTYGAPYHWSLIKNMTYYQHAYKYVYRNPIEAGLTFRVEDYAYSTLQTKLGLAKSIIPVTEDFLLFESVENSLLWLNTSYPDQESKLLIKSALKKREFKFAKDKHGKPVYLDSQII
ncbi:MAG: transposase [Bdellovibrionaceae bacterium]|nr:transposase [Pseudobdellovibrionaceae bacterium]